MHMQQSFQHHAAALPPIGHMPIRNSPRCVDCSGRCLLPDRSRRDIPRNLCCSQPYCALSRRFRAVSHWEHSVHAVVVSPTCMGVSRRHDQRK